MVSFQPRVDERCARSEDLRGVGRSEPLEWRASPRSAWAGKKCAWCSRASSRIRERTLRKSGWHVRKTNGALPVMHRWLVERAR